MPRTQSKRNRNVDPNVEKEPKWRINAKNYFLTYSQCDYEPKDLMDYLLELEGDLIKWMVVAQELHEDGNPHLHVQIEYERARNLRNERHFDTDRYHPNVQGTRKLKKVGEYVTKGGDYVLYGATEEEFRLAISGKKLDKWAEIYASETYEEACEAVKRIDPRSWGNNGDRIRSNLRYEFKRKFEPYHEDWMDHTEMKDAYTPPEVQEWLDTEYVKKSRAKCLFLIGESQLGKTHWARSIVDPHNYWKNMVNLDKWNPDAKLLIFDDIDWKYMPNPKGYLTQAGECDVTDKYRHKMTIKVNMPAIFLCNEMPVGECGVPLCDDAYWKKCGVFVRVYDKMYVQ